MKTELTIRESAKLIDLGLAPRLASTRKVEYDENFTPCYHAVFSLIDILSILPKEIVADTIMGEDFLCALAIKWDEDRKVWYCGYGCLPHPLNVGESPELIDALYSLLVWLLESKIINLKEK